MKTQLDMDRIAKGLRAKRRGKVDAPGGFFGAMQLAALLLERSTEKLKMDEARELVRPKRRAIH